jgi:hypothetical protein
MITKAEFEEYRSIATSEKTKAILGSGIPIEVSKLELKVSGYYARLASELAPMKNQITTEFLILTRPDDNGQEMKVGKAQHAAEAIVDAQHQVTRREIEYLMKGMDKIQKACSNRLYLASREIAHQC